MSKDITYGNVELDESELDIKKAKFRVNAWIDGDIIEKLRDMAKERGTKYQTLMNSILREAVLKEAGQIEDLIKRIEALEKKQA